MSDTATLYHCTYVCNSIFVHCDLTLLETNCNTCRITLVHMALYVCGEFVKVIGAMQPTTSNPTLPSQFIQVQKSNSLLSLGFSTQQAQTDCLNRGTLHCFQAQGRQSSCALELHTQLHENEQLPGCRKLRYSKVKIGGRHFGPTFTRLRCL